MPQLSANDIRIRYDDFGSGPPVFLTHGFSATGSMWEPQRAALADYRLITWDMRGHGHTEAPEDPAQYSSELTVTDMKAIMDSLGVDRAVVGGLSLGGVMSMHFYATYPEMVRALVIADSGPGFRSEGPRKEWNDFCEQRATELEEKGLDALVNPSAEVQRAKTEHQSAPGIAHAARGMMAQSGTRLMDLLPEIEVPTLVIVGDRDEPFLGAANYMTKKIPGARLEIIEDAGHASNIDQPEAFNAVLLDFLASLPEA